MKKKILTYTFLSLLLAVTITIVVLCTIYLTQPVDNKDNGGKGNSGNSSYSFEYENKLDLYYGDTFNLAPTNIISPLIYISSNTAILQVSSDGDITTNKCGDATITIKNGTETIKTVNINVSLNYTFIKPNKCTFDNNTIRLSAKTCYFNLGIVNSTNEEVKVNENPTISTTDGITSQIKLGSIWLTANNDGKVYFSYPSINATLEFNIITSK